MIRPNRVGQLPRRRPAREGIIELFPLRAKLPVLPDYCLGRTKLKASPAISASGFERRLPRFQGHIGKHSPEPNPRSEFFRNQQIAFTDPTESGKNRRSFVREKGF